LYFLTEPPEKHNLRAGTLERRSFLRESVETAYVCEVPVHGYELYVIFFFFLGYERFERLPFRFSCTARIKNRARGKRDW
jgi:hypothetical protein